MLGCWVFAKFSGTIGALGTGSEAGSGPGIDFGDSSGGWIFGGSWLESSDLMLNDFR